MNVIRAEAYTETAGNASAGHAEFPTLRVGLVLQLMGTMRCHSRLENLSACPAERWKESKIKIKRRE